MTQALGHLNHAQLSVGVQGGVHAVGEGGAQLLAMSRQQAHALCVPVREGAGSGPDVYAWVACAGGGCRVCLMCAV
jgi:hypothetical protein